MISEFLDWKFLPDLILEQIFIYLSPRDRLSASCTCIPWNQTFYNPCLWKTFSYSPPAYLQDFNQRIYYDIATYNLSMCFRNIGYSFQSLMIPPISDFFILNRTLNVMTDFYSKQYKIYGNNEEVNPLCDYRSKLEHFRFEFDSQVENGTIYGTGGTLLVSIKGLLDILTNLKSIRLKSLLVTAEDRVGLLDGLVKNNRDSLTKLSLIDISKTSMADFELLNFTNLRQLQLSTFEICPDLLVNLIQETKIDILILTQTRFTLFSEEFASVEPISGSVWQLVTDLNPNFKVHQCYTFTNISDFIDLNSISIVYQPRSAPITRYAFLSNHNSLLDLHRVEQYYQTLTEIIIIIDSFADSPNATPIDEELFQFVTANPHLTSLVLGGGQLSVHASTIIYLIGEIFPKLEQLIVQVDCVQYVIDNIPIALYHHCLASDRLAASTDRDQFRSVVRSQLKLPNWNLLHEKEFSFCVDKHEYID